MDVYVILRKLDKDGQAMLNLNLPWDAVPISKFSDMKPQECINLVLYFGPVGMLRASHRAIDDTKSLHPLYPFHPHAHEDKIVPGEIVELQIGIWAMGIAFEAGESIQLRVMGQRPRLHEFSNDSDKGLNRGKHYIHIGPQYPSHVTLPFID
jgi:hypothetical protein